MMNSTPVTVMSRELQHHHHHHHHHHLTITSPHLLPTVLRYVVYLFCDTFKCAYQLQTQSAVACIHGNKLCLMITLPRTSQQISAKSFFICPMRQQHWTDYEISLCVCESVSQSVNYGTPSISQERLKLETSNLANRLATGGPNEKMQN